MCVAMSGFLVQVQLPVAALATGKREILDLRECDLLLIANRKHLVSRRFELLLAFHTVHFITGSDVLFFQIHSRSILFQGIRIE